MGMAFRLVDERNDIIRLIVLILIDICSAKISIQ
jgi:hypothetical protein